MKATSVNPKAIKAGFAVLGQTEGNWQSNSAGSSERKKERQREQERDRPKKPMVPA